MGQTEELPDSTRLLNFIYDEGIGIGWYNANSDDYLIKTFIANEMLNKTQQGLRAYLLNESDAKEFSTILRPEH